MSYSLARLTAVPLWTPQHDANYTEEATAFLEQTSDEAQCHDAGCGVVSCLGGWGHDWQTKAYTRLVRHFLRLQWSA